MNGRIKLVDLRHPMLHQSAHACKERPKWIDKHVMPFIYPMKELMDAAGGVGLAAPQVGIPLRFFLMRQEGRASIVINPVVRAVYGPKIAREEGCLSFLDRGNALVERHEEIDVEWAKTTGERFRMRLRGMDARVFQHETDHLNGICIFP